MAGNRRICQTRTRGIANRNNGSIKQLINKIMAKTDTEIVEITKTNALKAYEEADEKGKKQLATLLKGQMTFGKITDRIKTFDDACEVEGLDAVSLVKKWKSQGDTADEIAYKKLKIIVKVLNEGWVPQMYNTSQYKYYSYFNLSGSGFAFHYTNDWSSDAGAGSRLCFRNSELAEYAGKIFISEYKEFLV